MPQGIVMQLSGYSIARLRDRGEFILYRAHGKQTELSSVLPPIQASALSSSETLKKIKYSLRSEHCEAKGTWPARRDPWMFQSETSR